MFFVSGTQSACMKWRRMDSSRFAYLCVVTKQTRIQRIVSTFFIHTACHLSTSETADVLLSTTPSTIHLSVASE